MSAASSLRGGAAIVGTGTAGWGGAPDGGHGPTELLAEACLLALGEAGLPLSAVDGVFAAMPGRAWPALAVVEYFGLKPRHCDDARGAALLRAALALQARLCDVALICDGTGSPAVAPTDPHEAPYGPRGALTGYALVAARHMHEFGTTREDLAEVAVAARGWAALNPLAARRASLTLREVLDSPMASDPLSVLDCGLGTEAGATVAAACVMMRAEAARDRPKPPAYLLGAAGAQWHRAIAWMPDLTTTAASESGPRACAMAGLTPRMVDLALIDDGCTIAPILYLEDLGFCPKGEGGRFVADGRIGPRGDLAVNTHGGALSCAPSGETGLLAVIEAVTQLRREAGARQVAACDVALVHGSGGGGAFASEVTTLLGTEATL